MVRDCTINFKGVEIVCHGDYYKGSFGDYENPPESAEFEITKITVWDSEADILELLDSAGFLEEITELAIEEFEDND